MGEEVMHCSLNSWLCYASSNIISVLVVSVVLNVYFRCLEKRLLLLDWEESDKK